MNASIVFCIAFAVTAAACAVLAWLAGFNAWLAGFNFDHRGPIVALCTLGSLIVSGAIGLAAADAFDETRTL